jgi:uncharacterized phage protein gp47/JayE
MLIASPTTGWTNVANDTTPIQGAAGETDAALRLRQQVSTSETAYRHVEAIYAGILNTAGVTFVRIYQNSTLTDAETTGITAKSIAAVVQGGTDAAVAAEMFKRVPVGLAYFGDTDVTVEDAYGTEYTVSFSRPTPVPIDVAIEVERVGNDSPDSYAADIKAAIVAYAQSGASAVGAPTTFEQVGIVPGRDVYLSQLYTPINSVPGLRVTSLEIAKHGESPAGADIVIAWNELATFDPANISVTLYSA